jgi:outer membrane protein assembly factor BamB
MMIPQILVALTLLGAAAPAAQNPAPASPTDWPAWRGPEGDGLARHAKPPVQWSQTSNILWKMDLPGRGHASPIVWGDRLWILTANDEAQTQSLLCYDRRTGRKLWDRLIHKGRFVQLNRKNSQASATPICDGKRVYTVLAIDDALFATAVDLDGQIVWQEKVGGYESEHGYGSSPVLYKSMLIVAGDHMGEGGGYIAAIDRETGQPVWKTKRVRTSTNSNYATPMVATVAGRPQLLIHGYNLIASYDPETGKLLWTCDGPTHVCANTIVAGKDHIYASGGYPRKQLLRIRADGTGNITTSHVEWTDHQGVAYVPSSILHGERLFVVDDQGIATCYDAKVGKPVWRQRLGGAFTASPTLAGGYLFVPAEDGVTHVIKASDGFEVVARNKLPGAIFATPAFCGNLIYLRTDTALYCIGESNAVQ